MVEPGDGRRVADSGKRHGRERPRNDVNALGGLLEQSTSRRRLTYLFVDCWTRDFWTPCHGFEDRVAAAIPREQRRHNILGQWEVV